MLETTRRDRGETVTSERPTSSTSSGSNGVQRQEAALRVVRSSGERLLLLVLPGADRWLLTLGYLAHRLETGGFVSGGGGWSC